MFFNALKVPVWKIIPVLESGKQTSQKQRMCTEEKNQLILSQPQENAHMKWIAWDSETQIKMAEVCIWVCLRKRWRVRLSVFTDIMWDPLRKTDRKRETVQPISAWVCGRETKYARALWVLESVSEYVYGIPPPLHAGVFPDLVLRRELLHVGAKTPEARQEVVDHHLLRNDCTGS